MNLLKVFGAPKPDGGKSEINSVQKMQHMEITKNYTLVKRIGEGGDAEVFLCQKGHQRVAISVPKSANRNPNEAKLYEVLNIQLRACSNHLIRCLDTVDVTVGGVTRVGFVLEYGGESLRSVMRREGKLRSPAAVAIHEQVCDAILCLVRMGWLHTDIGPSNILVNEAGSVKVCDYGDAMPVSEFSVANYRNNRRYGAPPSYVKNPDFFSAALSLYEMVAGEHLIAPYEDGSDFESLKLETVRRKLTFYEGGSMLAVYRRKIEALGGDIACRITELLDD